MENTLTNNDYLNSLRDAAYAQAKLTGWHRNFHSKEHFLCLIISELIEAVQADRVDRRADLSAFNDSYEDALYNKKLYGDELDGEFIKFYKRYISNCLEDELADTCIRIFDLAGYMGLPLSVCKDKVVLKTASFTENIFAITKVLTENVTCPSNALDVALSNVFLLAEYLKIINLDVHIQLKMRYNSLRPFMHGCKKY